MEFYKDNGPYLIAELGVNMSGNLQTTKRLIDAAYSCGWDCVKFQKRTPEICVPEDQKQKPKETPWGIMPYIEYRKITEFERLEYDYIDEYCRAKPIDWTASVWDTDSLNFLSQYDVPFIKIPSAHLTNDELLDAAANSGKHVMLSTGMSTPEEIDAAVDLLESEHCSFSLLHCNSSYPAADNELNILCMGELRAKYMTASAIGYSGHETGIEPTVVAAVLGADIIERHITLDKTSWGSDQANSLEPHEMNLLVKRIGKVRECMGDGKKVLYESEIPSRIKLRG